MPRYAERRKASVMLKLLPPNNPPIPEASDHNGGGRGPAACAPESITAIPFYPGVYPLASGQFGKLLRAHSPCLTRFFLPS